MTTRKPSRAIIVRNFHGSPRFAWRFIDAVINEVGIGFQRSGLEVLEVISPIEEGTLRDGQVVVPLTHGTFGAMLRSLVYLRGERARVVYLTDQPALHPRYLLWRACGVRRIIVHDHTSGRRSEPSGLRRLAKLLAWKIPGMSADLVVCVSEFVRHRARRVGLVPTDHLLVVHNGVDVPEAAPESPSLTVVALARATKVKGIDVLLRAWADVLKSWPGDRAKPRLRYAGDGPQLSELKALASALGIYDSVEFLGYIHEPEHLLRTASVCVVPSTWDEAFCLVAAEALACGIPVIGSTAGALPELIDFAPPWTRPPVGDSQALAESLTTCLLLTEQERRSIGMAGRQRILQRFRLDDTLRKMRDVAEDEGASAVTSALGTRLHRVRRQALG